MDKYVEGWWNTQLAQVMRSNELMSNNPNRTVATLIDTADCKTKNTEYHCIYLANRYGVGPCDASGATVKPCFDICTQYKQACMTPTPSPSDILKICNQEVAVESGPLQVSGLAPKGSTCFGTAGVTGMGGNITSHTSNTLIIIAAVVGGTAVIVCILSTCHYFRCLQTKHPADDAHLASHPENGSAPARQLSSARQPQHQHRQPEQMLCLQLTGDEDRDVFKISLADLNLAPESLAAGSFNEVFLARLPKTMSGIGHAGHKVAVIQIRDGNIALSSSVQDAGETSESYDALGCDMHRLG